MSKVIRYNKNGIMYCADETLKDKEEIYSLCNKCNKRDKISVNKNCHLNNKINELSAVLGVSIPIFSCVSFSGDISEPVIEPPKVEPKVEDVKPEPKVEPPKVEPPKVETPKVEPKVELKVTSEVTPKVVEPKVEAPKVEDVKPEPKVKPKEE